MILPMTAGSVPNRECQYFELMTATGVAVGLVVVGQDRAAEARVDAEHLIVVAGRDERGRDLRLAIDEDVDAAERRAGNEVGHRRLSATNC